MDNLNENIDFNQLVSDSGDVVTGGKNYSANDWFVTVKLSEFYGSRFETMENDEGEEEEYLCIPIKSNNLLKTSRRNIIVTFCATMAERVNERFTHTLTQILDSDVKERRKQLGFRIPIMGHMRPRFYKQKKY